MCCLCVGKTVMQQNGEEEVRRKRKECTGVNGLLMEAFAIQDHGQRHRETPAKLQARA